MNLIQKRNYVKSLNHKSKSKILQCIKGIMMLYHAVEAYTKEYLINYERASWLFLVMGFISLFITPNITIFLPVSLIYFISLCQFLLSFIINVFITYKKLKFIIEYNLDCNPKEAVKAIVSSLIVAKPVFKYTAVITGGALATNYFLQDLRGVNVVEEIGRNYIDDEKTIGETSKII
jgi:hypothetical protein